VTLVGVTKTVDAAAAEALFDAGIPDLAENRPVEGAEKVAAVRRPATWHFIGHLQTNKVPRVLGAFSVIHSLDRADLARALEKRLDGGDRRVPVFVQVNVSGEASKGGLRPEELPGFLERGPRDWPHLNVAGLMTMAPASPDPGAARPCFRALAGLARDRGLAGLSMGMSGDYEVAVEEGATHVRIGNAFFGESG
jgi:pyridoxal phosphate enzyme (YggS family)